MKIYWQWENVRVYRGIALVCVHTTSMASSAYLWSTPPVWVYPIYPTSICLPRFHMSTPPQQIYSTSTCLPHFHMSTPHPHVYCISTCPLHFHMSTLHPRVYPSFKYLIQFRTHVEFENENTFALASSQWLLYGWAWELCFLLMNRTLDVWMFFFSIIVLHENQKANEDSWNFIHSAETYESTCLLYLHVSTLPLHFYSTSTCLLYLHVSILPPHV